ncbi:MAG: BMP family ABC transporter substrate-binding protein [Lachnospiraceae bacterium]|nr:BMP family ABC transporter substrate-binding protein [Lachnospiraceae bacterium]
MKKKLLSVLMVAAMAIGCLAGCGDKAGDATGTEGAGTDVSADSDYAVAMITDYGDITDQSFNQTTYEACQAFCNDNGIDFNYYKPTGDSTAERVASVEQAIDEGYNVIVMPGYAFGGTIVEVSETYKDVKFIALDVAAGDILEAGVAAAGESYDYNPDNWNITDYCYMDNVYCAIYQEELSGYMAGYAAVKLGYTKLGFLGGMAVPAVIRYGYGFVQGADAAASELGTDIQIQYAYGNQFYGDADITAAMDTWYAAGTEVVFACGGGIFSSAAEAASKEGVNGKVIGVDVDQAATIDGQYGEGMTVTSAMKGLYPATYDTLTDVIVNGNWANYAGKISTLGLVSAEDPTLNYCQIPMESTQWSDGFTQDDYVALVAAMVDGSVKVSNDISAMPAVSGNTTVNDLGNLK